MKGQKRLCGCAYDWCISSERRLGTVPSTRSLQPAPTCGGKLETFMRRSKWGPICGFTHPLVIPSEAGIHLLCSSVPIAGKPAIGGKPMDSRFRGNDGEAGSHEWPLRCGASGGARD